MQNATKFCRKHILESQLVRARLKGRLTAFTSHYLYKNSGTLQPARPRPSFACNLAYKQQAIVSTNWEFCPSVFVYCIPGMKSRSQRLGLETASRLDFDCLGLERKGLVCIPTVYAYIIIRYDLAYYTKAIQTITMLYCRVLVTIINN